VNDELTRRLIELRHAGTKWTECADLLDVPINDLRRLSTELRDAGRWCLEDGSPARGVSMNGLKPRGSGRPRDADPAIAIGTRVMPDVLECLREVASANGITLRATIAAALRREHTLVFVPRRVTVAPKVPLKVCIPTSVHSEFFAGSRSTPCRAIADALEQFVVDLGCELVAQTAEPAAFSDENAHGLCNIGTPSASTSVDD
jgi:hypothetical protein